MRKRYALVVLVPFAILAACEESENGGGLGPNLDGGQPAFDAAAPPPPPPADAGDAGPAPVSVTVTRAGAPAANVPVVFHDATGVVLATVMTSAAGLAAQVVPAGSQVTVVTGSATTPHLLTITEVEPGDLLTAVDFPATPESRDVSVTSVPSGAPANSKLAARIGRCGGNFAEAPPFDIFVQPRCQFAGTFPVLVTAHDQETNDELGFTFKKANQLPATDGGAPINVEVTEPWSTAVREHTIAVTNVPPSASADTVFSEITGGVTIPSSYGLYNDNADAGTMQTLHRGHAGFPDFVQSEIVRRTYNGNVSVTGIATREAPPIGAATTTFNFADLLPNVDEATIDETTKERPSVTWKTEAGKSLDTADGAYVLVRWYVSVDEGYKFGDWTFVTPANRTTVKAPQLPANLTDFAPPAGDAGLSFQTPAIVTVVEGAAINGYRDFRKIGASVPAAAAIEWSDGADTFIPPLPAAGTLRATAYTRSND